VVADTVLVAEECLRVPVHHSVVAVVGYLVQVVVCYYGRVAVVGYSEGVAVVGYSVEVADG
jgi:hypothetical protein